MSAKNHTVSSYFARAHLANGVRLGLHEAHTLRQAGLSRAVLQEPKARIAPHQLALIVRQCWVQGNDELLGLAQHPQKYGVFAILAERLVQLSSLGQVLQEMVRFYNLVGDALHCQLLEQPGQVGLQIQVKPTPSPPKVSYANSLLIEFLLLVWHRFPSWLVGQLIALQSVQFEFKEPAHSGEYRLMFPCPCYFRQSGNVLWFDAKQLDLPVVQNLAGLKKYLQRTPEQWFRKQGFYQTHMDLVVRYLESIEHPHDATLEDVAQQFHMSGRTLRRKLTLEGSGFQALKDQVRRDMAIHFLADKSKSISQVGRQVGIHEPAAFTRAFKQWTGLSPGVYRKGMGF